MKKTLIISIAILGLSTPAIAQDNIIIKMEKTGINIPYTVTGDDTDYSSGHAAYEYNVSSATTVHFEMEITNNTGVSKSWRVKRFNQDVTPSDWNSYIKCASLCFPVSSSNPYVTPASDFTSNPQQIRTIELANGDHGLMGFHVVVTSPGTGKYWLYLTDNDNTLHEDSIEIQINYSSLGLNEKGKQEVFNMYPNPSNNKVSIQLNNNEIANLKIVDVLGNIIYTEEINTTSDINVSEFKNGIYFVTIETNGVQSQMEKLIIKH